MEAVAERPHTGMMAELNEKGDTKILWDKNNDAEVEIARAAFDRAMAKGYAAFRAVGEEGRKGDRIRTFDKNAERIILVPNIAGG